MVLSHPSQSGRWKSPLLTALLIVGLVGWLFPSIAAARRTWNVERFATQITTPREVVLLVTPSAGDLCVQGTSLAGPRRTAVIDGHVVGIGQTIQADGATFRITEIDAESVHLREVTSVEEIEQAAAEQRQGIRQ